MMKLFIFKHVFIAVLCVLLANVLLADINKDRASMNQLHKDGNWKEALEQAKENFSNTSDELSELDLQCGIDCMRKLGKYDEFEDFMSLVNEKHANSSKVLVKAAVSLGQVATQGAWFDEEFERGANPWRRNGTRGEYGYSNARDRVRMLQFYERAYTLVKENDAEANEKIELLDKWADVITRHRVGYTSWKLQMLTDTSVLPDFEIGYIRHSGTSGAPVDAEGNPVFYEVPISYEKAKNDGERWRWLMNEQGKLSEKRVVYVQRKVANFLRNEFGVQTMTSFPWYRRMVAKADEEKQAGVLQVHTLEDNETIAKLANTVKKFEMSDTQNFIKLYRANWEAGDADSADVLVEIYLNRRQYVRAAELLDEITAKVGENINRTKKLVQIRGDWGKFEGQRGAFTTEENKRVALVYRNAKSIELTLHEMDLKKLNEDIWKFLKSNPTKVEYNKTNWRNLLHGSVNGEYNKYIGEQVVAQKYELKPREGHWDTRANLTLPKIKKSGAYLLRGELENGKKFYSMVWVDDMMVISRQVDGGKLYLVTDAETGKPLADVEMVFRGYETKKLEKKSLFRKYNTITNSYTKTTNAQGEVLIENIGKQSSMRYMVEARLGEKRAWLDFDNMWSWHRDVNGSYKHVKAFGITSQPVYKPGSEVQGKFWLREVKYDLGNESTFAGLKCYITINDPQGNELIGRKEVIADEYGGIPFSIEIPDDATLGAYQVYLNYRTKYGRYGGSHMFRVEKYKKPEYLVSVEAPDVPVQLGDTFEAIVKANYYHGAPVTNAKVKVTILRHEHNALWFPYGRWDWLYGAGYGWLDIERPWYPGWISWGCKRPYPFWYHRGYSSPEMVLDKELEIGEDGTVKVKVDTALAKLVHSDKDHRYEIKVEVVDASRRTIFSNGSVLATRKPFQVTSWLNRGYAMAGERIQASIAANTLDGREVKGWVTSSLVRVSSDANGKIKETIIREWDKMVFNNNTKKIDFKVDVAGQYRLVHKVTDEQGREVEGAIVFTILGVDGEKGDVRYNDLELITDKRTYTPGDTVKLLVNTKREDSFVMLFVRGTKDRRVITVKGNSQVVEIPVTLDDMPNFFIEAVTVSNARMHTQVREIIVPPEKRVLNVEVVPNSQEYKPQEKGTVKIKVTDELGNPVTGDCAMTIYDKSLEYISGGSNVADIKSFFWKWRRHYRQGYWRQSIVIAGGNTVKKKTETMQFLGVFGQNLNMHLSDDPFAEADADAFGGAGGSDPFASNSLAKSKIGRRAKVNSVKSEDLSAPSAPSSKDVSESGGDGGVNEVLVRKDFADLIKWKGSVKLDDKGMAEVPVEYPDNLTTWKIQTWAMAHGTRVGHGSAEVITSKDLIIRLQAPRFFIEKDEVVLSAVVHNYHDEKADAKVSLELEGGTLEVIQGELNQNIALGAKNGEKRVDWRIKVKREGEAIVRMKVVTANDTDAMEMTFPVHVHGILKQMAWSSEVEPGQDSTKIVVEVPEERRPEESKLEVRFSPTIAGALVDALPYLVDYPHGCTEQTLNRFVPTVITQRILKNMGIDLEEVRNKRTNLNPQEMGDDRKRADQWKHWKRNPVFNQEEVDMMVRAGVKKLIDMQVSDGGWGWFSGYGEKSYPHTTAVVVHGLKIAQQNGAKIPQDRIDLGVQWLKRYEEIETERIRMYGKRKKNTKQRASTIDYFVRLVLSENGIFNQEMLGYQFRDKNDTGVYAKSLLGMSLHLVEDSERRDAVIRNIEQFLVYDEENQTAFLEMKNGGYWWYWYGNDIEAHSWYLKLLTAVKPKSKETRGIVKFLMNNRKNGTYWNSTRDTAYAIEAIADYMKASGESDPNTEVEVLVDGVSYKKVSISKENLFSYDNKMTLAGDVLTSGKHTVEIRRTGNGPLYTNAYLTVFTKEDFIEKAGLEVKVERRFYKLVSKKSSEKVAGAHGQVVDQKVEKFDRVPLKVGDAVLSGDTIEVELILESKNDYEYLMFSDFKAAGTEAEAVRSGYVNTGNVYAYMEVHDERVNFFIRHLAQGKHSLTYKLRAEIPGKFSALPATADAMYAPELRANSDEMKLEITE